MVKTIFAYVWVLAAVATLMLGMNGSLDPAVMLIFSLLALGLLYAFALRTVIVNTRSPQPAEVKQPGFNVKRR